MQFVINIITQSGNTFWFISALYSQALSPLLGSMDNQDKIKQIVYGAVFLVSLLFVSVCQLIIYTFLLHFRDFA